MANYDPDLDVIFKEFRDEFAAIRARISALETRPAGQGGTADLSPLTAHLDALEGDAAGWTSADYAKGAAMRVYGIRIPGLT